MLLLSVLLLSAATIASASEQSTTDVPNNDTTTEANMGSTVQITSTDGSLMTFTPSSNADGSNSTTTTPSNSTTETTVPPSMELQRNSSGRAINFSISEDGEENNSSEVIKGSLQDLSLDDIDISSIMTTMPDFMPNFTISQTNVTPTAMTSTTAASESGVICMEGDALYRMGETFNRGCDETCKCDAGGQVSCMPRCSEPLFRRGSRKDDPMCFERATNDPCCATLVCGQDTELEPLEVCHYKNESYQRGEMFNEGCESLCSCGEAGKITCKPRCPVVAHNSSDQCVALLDPTDACCTVIRCDVTLGDHDGNESGPEDHASQFLQLLAAEVVNGSAVKLEVVGDMPANITIEKSTDQKSWKPQESDGLIVVGLEPGNTYYLRANAGGVVSNAVQVITPLAKEPSSDMTSHAGGCQYKGMNYSIGQEFNDGCEAYCICSETGLECAKIDCPTDFGLDVIDSHCLEWDMQPNGFVAIPPKCCPDEIKCKNNGSCEYIGETYNNWEEIPTSVTGCEKRCLCKFGNVTCETVCPPLSATPPVDIRCQPHEAILDHQPGDNCCLYWMCPSVQHPGPGTDDRKNGQPETEQRPFGSPMKHNISLSSGQTYSGPFHFDTSFNQQFLHEDKSQSNQKKPIPKENFPGPFSPSHFDQPLDSMRQTPLHESPVHSKTSIPASNGQYHLPVHPEQVNKSETMLRNIATTPSDNSHSEQMQDNKMHKSTPSSSNIPLRDINDKMKSHKQHPYDVWPPLHPPTHGGTDEATLWFHPVPTREFQEPHVDPHINIHPHQVLPKSQEIAPKKKPQINGGDSLPKSRPEGHQDVSYVSLEDFLASHHEQGQVPPPYTIYQEHTSRFPVQQYLSHGKPSLNEERYVDNLQQKAPPPHGQGYSPIQQPGWENQQVYMQAPEPLSEQHLIEQLVQIGLLPPQLHQQKNRSRHPYEPSSPTGDNRMANVPSQHHIPERPILNNPQPLSNGEPPSSNYQVIIPHEYNTHPVAPSSLHDIQHFFPPPGQRLRNLSHAEHGITTLPHGYYKFPNIIGSHHPDEMLIETLEPLDPRTVRIVLSVPPVLVGLHGHVELRYTADKQNNDISTWEQRVLEPSDDLIAVSRIEFFIDGLQPATEYRIKASIILRDLHNSPSSAIMTVQTPPEVPSTTLPPIIDVFPHLSVMKVNTTWITVTWHKFDDFKRNLIDGIQLRYKEVDDKVYSTTPLIHRAVTEYTIEGLKPNTMYEIGILFIPFPMQTTELQANSSIKVNTTEGQDMYKFDVQVEIYNIKATTVEVNWTGVPYPVDKYVNIFRAIYQSDSGKEDFSAFKVAKRDSLSTTLIKDLIPGTRYRLWLEVYLTNGRIKKSNVQDFSTKPGSISTAESSQQGKLESSPTPVNQAGDYYSPLVAVSILAALAILATLILLLILMRKHSQNKAAISTSRKSQSAYDNPSYKTCEDPSPVNGNGTAKTSEPS